MFPKTNAEFSTLEIALAYISVANKLSFSVQLISASRSILAKHVVFNDLDIVNIVNKNNVISYFSMMLLLICKFITFTNCVQCTLYSKTSVNIVLDQNSEKACKAKINLIICPLTVINSTT